MARTATSPKTAAASVSRVAIPARETGKAAPPQKAEPQREVHSYNWRSRANLKQNQVRG
jgi:hypothetical protein